MQTKVGWSVAGGQDARILRLYLTDEIVPLFSGMRATSTFYFPTSWEPKIQSLLKQGEAWPAPTEAYVTGALAAMFAHYGSVLK